MHEPVLVLNANFEPINICSSRRAIGLIIHGKAQRVLHGLKIKITRSYPSFYYRLEKMVSHGRESPYKTGF
jgi:hypothetical protein